MKQELLIGILIMISHFFPGLIIISLLMGDDLDEKPRMYLIITLVFLLLSLTGCIIAYKK